MRLVRPETPPRPGLYLDSTGVLYRAACHPKTGWSLTRQPHRSGHSYDAHPFSYADFPRAVREGIFVITPNP